MKITERSGEVATTTEAFAGEADQAVLDQELNVIAGHLNAQHARLVDATIELLENPIRWKGPGVWTPEQYLGWRVGLAPNRAHQIVDIARRVDELPICVAAFRRGEMTIDAMASIAKRAPWWTDDTACNYGTAMTISQLRNVLAKYPFPDIPHPDTTDPDTSDPDAVDPDAVDPDEANATADATRDSTHDDDSNDGIQGRPADTEPDGHCRLGWDDTGRFHMSLDTDGATGAIIETALTEARDSLFNDGNTDLDWVDAIRELCNRSLDAIGSSDRRDRFRINIHLDTDSNAVGATGWRLPDAIRRFVTCDGLLSPVFVADGIALSVGRSQRIVPERTRRHVILRDQGCRIPGCGARRFLEVHHIIHWADLGPTDTHNLICLCPHHHRLHHQGTLGITGNADRVGGVVITNAAGNPIAQTGAKPRPPAAPPPSPTGTYRHPLGERLDTKWVYFNPPREHRGVMGSAAAPPDMG